MSKVWPTAALGASLLVLCSCASVQESRNELLSKASCCSTIADLPYQIANAGEGLRFAFSNSSPVFAFPEGKSYFYAISIESSAVVRQLRLRVNQDGFHAIDPEKNALVICPTVVFQDRARNTIASVDLSVSKARPTSFLGPDISESFLWHAATEIPANTAYMVFYTKQTHFGRRNALPLYRFTQVIDVAYVPCGPTGSVEVIVQ